VFVVSPTLALKGVQYEDNFIKTFSGLLFAWDLFWLMFKKPIQL